MAKKHDVPEGASPGEKLVAQGAMVMRFENDQMMAAAVARPRNEAEVKERALRQLEEDPEAAASAYYSIPFKEHSKEGNCTGRSDDECPVKEWVENIGIDGARELARLWRNNVSRVYFVDEDDDWVRLSGVFVDLESNTREEVPYAVPKVGVSRRGAVYTLDPRRLSMAIQAGVSKCARNAIVAGVPRHLSRAYWERAREIAAGTDAIEVPRLLEAFASFRVTREQLEGFYQSKLEELSKENRRNLRGLFIAIREGHVDPEQFFAGAGDGKRRAESAATSKNSGHAEGCSPSPVAGATARVRGGTVAAPAGQPNGELSGAGDTPEKAPPAPSQPTPEPVSSPPPNEPAEPTQADLEGLGI